MSLCSLWYVLLNLCKAMIKKQRYDCVPSHLCFLLFLLITAAYFVENLYVQTL